MIVIQNWVVRFGHVDTHRRETWADYPRSGGGIAPQQYPQDDDDDHDHDDDYGDEGGDDKDHDNEEEEDLAGQEGSKSSSQNAATKVCEMLQKLANKGELYNIGILHPPSLCPTRLGLPAGANLDFKSKPATISFSSTIRSMQITTRDSNNYTLHLCAHKDLQITEHCNWFQKAFFNQIC